MSGDGTVASEALAAALAAHADGLPQPPTGPVPLTPSQSGFWFAWKLDAGGSAGNRPVGIRISGQLDPQALDDALGAILVRHDALRSVYTEIEGTPVQIEMDDPRLEVESGIDVTRQSDPFVAAKTDALRFIARRFDLPNELPLRAMLYRLGERDHLLVLVVHHVAFDGWSEQILLTDLESRYNEHHGPGAAPTAAPTAFASYATWVDRRRDDERVAADLDHWRQNLDGIPSGFGYLGEPDREATVIEPVATTLDPSIATAIKDTATALGTTPFTVLLAGFGIVLDGYATSPEHVIAVVSGGRDHPDIEQTIGCFVKTVPVRSSIDRTQSVSDLIRRTHADVVDALSHTAAPFGRIVSDLQPRTRATEVYPFPVLFQMRNFPMHRTIGLHETRFDSVRLHQTPGDFDLSVRATATDGTFTIDIEYEAERFSTADVEQILTSYVNILSVIGSSPESTIGAIPLITPERRHQELHEFNTDPWGHDDPLPIRVIEERMAAHPLDIAYIEDGTETTYGELNQLANTVADTLLGHGAGPNAVVVLYLRNSRAFVVGMLGTMKAGAAFANVDATDTRKWIGDIVEDTEPIAIVTTTDLVPDVEPLGVPYITADDLEADDSLPNPDVEIAMADRCFILFTSGSTGRPKGVVHSQGSLAAFAACGIPWDFRPGDRVAQMHVIGFDPALNATILPLMVGSALIARDEAARGTIDRFLAWCVDMRITHLLVPRSFFHTMEERATAERLPLPSELRVISAGGEQVRTDSAQRWHDTYGHDITHLNSYGPTEAITASAMRLDGLDPQPDPIPVGRASARATAYVLDERGEPLPLGVIGEVVIGGPYVAEGYLNRPDLAESVFRPDPFSAHAGARLYHTGDLGRRLASGDIEYRGRSDRQVKIRGLRVEPSGVEYQMRLIEGVADCVVVPFEAPDGTKQLAAYAVPRPGSTIDADALRDSLSAVLPEFTMPSAISILPSLPRLSSGKVALSDLPAPSELSETSESRNAPDGPVLRDVRRIWASVLGRGTPEPEDDFFELGGYSLAAARVLARVKDRYGIDLPLSALYDHPTPSRFAAQIPVWLEDDPPEGIVVLRKGGTLPPLFCMHIVSGEVYSYEPMAALLADGQPVLGIVATSPTGSEGPPATIPDMATAHATVIEKVSPTGPIRLIGYSWAARLAMETAATLESRGRIVDFLGIIDSWHPAYEQDQAAARMAANARSAVPGSASLARLRRLARAPRRIWYLVLIGWHRLRGGALPQWAMRTRQTRIGVRAMSTYEPRTPSCMVTYFRAVDDQGHSTDDRWRTWVEAENVEILDIVGDHRGEHAIVAAGHVEDLAGALNARLSERSER